MTWIDQELRRQMMIVVTVLLNKERAKLNGYYCILYASEDGNERYGDMKVCLLSAEDQIGDLDGGGKLELFCC
ncbi:MAG: hypothetical protein EZS28_009105 [Streblomastix strix]|uniref:Uncharacterized protein n=1 Tax=Streblomastix strix TaxID=222440 RepID=A0A5J4WLV4_9EUKA|nr:MAG: hypothetical protein EZS28_009105 [Streblomastix strix]